MNFYLAILPFGSPIDAPDGVAPLFQVHVQQIQHLSHLTENEYLQKHHILQWKDVNSNRIEQPSCSVNNYPLPLQF